MPNNLNEYWNWVSEPVGQYDTHQAFKKGLSRATVGEVQKYRGIIDTSLKKYKARFRCHTTPKLNPIVPRNTPHAPGVPACFL